MAFIETLKKNPIIYKVGVYMNILYFDFFVDSIDYIKCVLRKYKIISPSKFDNIRNLKGKHKGQRCFIIATGPSLTINDLELLKNEYTIGVNSLVKVLDKISFLPTYLGIQDGNVFDKISNEIEESKLGKILLTDELYRKIKCKDTERYIQYPLYCARHSRHNDIRPLSSGFSDKADVMVYDGYSVTYSMLQIAIYMGFTEIYLLGCDCSYDVKGGKQHFIESGHFDKHADSAGERMIYAYHIAKEWLDKNHPDIHVYNITRGGMLNVFPRKRIEDVVN